MLLRKDSAPDQNNLELKFLDRALKKGQAQVKELDFIPLPDDVVKLIEAAWAKEVPAAWKTAAK